MDDCICAVLSKEFSKYSGGLRCQATAKNQFTADDFRNDSIYLQNPENPSIFSSLYLKTRLRSSPCMSATTISKVSDYYDRELKKSLFF